ncbi:GreA/GreB family elongation factor [Flagellimonas beolgyonensis]|uniref:GreA/GreB family elongation factor n=1 Tax=Flagellimonas beolgyonensis TaxID=864064 RepID=UPI000F8C8FB3|nr:GreA/GreB family elongation factor [Allomuricauda beolgyonensis]
MKYGNLIFEKNEFLMTRKFLKGNPLWEDYAHQYVLETLEKNLDNAIVMDKGQVPSDVIGLYSMVTIVDYSGQRRSFRLVPPNGIDAKEDHISVISGLGASLIGFSKGDRISHGLPGNQRSLLIENVVQGPGRMRLSISDADLRNMVVDPRKNKEPKIDMI